ncbi:MAG: biotin--[acetyl-CoA-carboxylase] ligase [Alphaproteobacteria bacterium]|nr:biotin--[acetyl-CoA-carboxylase] ligase [Alphaproteobacteria bacterium]
MLFDIRKRDVTTSTNDDAKRAAVAGAPEGFVIWALHQTQGRGRIGRPWQSDEGNLFFSVVLRPPLPRSEWAGYSFVAALAVQETVDYYVNKDIEGAFSVPHNVEMKWPNDVLVDGKKISGILLESEDDNWLVLGIGINVRCDPDNPMYPATSLASETPAVPELGDLLDRVLDSFDSWYARLNHEGFLPIRAAWLMNARKGTMRVKLPAKATEFYGEFLDLDIEGALRLRLQDGSERKVSAGDVFPFV